MRRRGKGFFEHGLEEVGGVGAGVLDLRFQRAAGRQQRLHSLHDRGLLGKRRERDDERFDFINTTGSSVEGLTTVDG